MVGAAGGEQPGRLGHQRLDRDLTDLRHFRYVGAREVHHVTGDADRQQAQAGRAEGHDDLRMRIHDPKARLALRKKRAEPPTMGGPASSVIPGNGSGRSPPQNT